MEYEYPYDIYETEQFKDIIVDLPDTENNAYVQTYIEGKREYAQRLYTDNNNVIASDISKEEGAILKYVSSFSPCVFCDLTISAIYELLFNDRVVRIGLYEDEEDVADTVFDSNDMTALSSILSIIRVDEAKNIYGVDGSGIKIGQIEPCCPNSSNVTKNSSASTTDDHATNVFTIMHSIANGAVYYASGYNSSTFVSNVEWLLTKGVNIINMSAGATTDYNTYTERARWVDHIAYNHDVHFVKSAGNQASLGVSSPGMAYNILTVGNVYRTSPYALRETSSYNINGADFNNSLTFKPDIVAPGVYVTGSGTSYSAPAITGILALMCELQPSLKTKQHVAKAIITCTTSKTTRRYNTEDSEFLYYGAGIADARSALYAINSSTYVATTGTVSSSSTTATYNMTVGSGDTLMRVALAYANRIKFSGSDHSLSSTPAGTIGELKLQVYSPSGVLCKECTISGANLKILSFDPRPYGTGTFKIKVTQTTSASGGRATNFGICWR